MHKIGPGNKDQNWQMPLDVANATYVDLIVMHLSCSSLRVSVNLASPALEPAIMPALQTSESVSVDLP